ncbi:hypothetical protein EAI_13515 [Harpegnathos saltator]|uniref:Uncharacterized protein n=1 Tax=Harpegnathos saltator TaxID=610380 RepID=E2B9D4_HARSA|nr:hypothetical protein EAI_13515 [Harpegnathos saltator]
MTNTRRKVEKAGWKDEPPRNGGKLIKSSRIMVFCADGCRRDGTCTAMALLSVTLRVQAPPLEIEPRSRPKIDGQRKPKFITDRGASDARERRQDRSAGSTPMEQPIPDGLLAPDFVGCCGPPLQPQ